MRTFKLSKYDLSIVVPLYNEEKRVCLLSKGLLDFHAQNRFLSYEIVLVNDGSSDGTAEKLANLEALLLEVGLTDVRLINLPVNKGKGGALQEGVIHSRGRWVLTIDSDMATPITQVLNWIDNDHFDIDSESEAVIVGDRRMSADVENSIFREITSLGFNYITRLLLPVRLKDTQCGFKIYPREIAKKCFGNLTESGWSHDIEILGTCDCMGVKSRSVPVCWTAIEGSKISPLRDMTLMFISLFRIRKSLAVKIKRMNRKI